MSFSAIVRLPVAVIEVPISVRETIDGASYTYEPSSVSVLLAFLLGIGLLGFGVYGAIREGFAGWKPRLVFGGSIFLGAIAIAASIINLGNYAVVTADSIEFTKSRKSYRIDKENLSSVEYYTVRARRNDIEHVVFHLRDGEKLDYTDPFLITAARRAHELFQQGAVAQAPIVVAEQPAAPAPPAPAPPASVDHSPSSPRSAKMPADIERLHQEMAKRHDERRREMKERFAARAAAAGDTPVPRPAGQTPKREPASAPAEIAQLPDAPSASSGRSVELPATAKQAKRGTPLFVGMPVIAKWGNSYFAAAVVALEEDGDVKVHYQGWSDNFDEVLGREKIHYEPAKLRTPSRESVKAKSSSTRAKPGDGVVRTWTDATGKHKVEAELVGNDDGVLKLKRKDGKIISLPISKLSESDQELVE